MATGEDGSGWNHARDHLPLLGAVGVTCFTAARLLVISGGNRATAFGLLQVAGPTSVVLGTLLTVVAIAPPVVGVSLMALLGTNSRVVANRRGLILFTLAICGVLSLFVTPPAFLPLWAFGPLYFIYPRSVDRWRNRRSAQRSEGARARMDARRKTYESAIPYIVGAAVFLFVLLALNMPPWWPYERIIIAGSPEPLVARVVGLDGGDTVILMDGRLSRITSTSIISREICAKGEDGFGTLFTGLDQRAVIGALGTQDYPDCPRP